MLVFLTKVRLDRSLSALNEKTALQGGFLEGAETCKFLNRGNSLCARRVT